MVSLLCFIFYFFSVQALSAQALTQSLNFEEMGVRGTLELPTVSAQHIIPFTVPKTWRVSGSKSYIDLELQHSSELLPKSSFIEIIINERPLFKTALTAKNSKATHLRIPLNRVSLKEQNTLKIRVEQHYTNTCEDPLDASLWTQVLNSSRFVFNYTPILPSVDLSAYPFPMVDVSDYRSSEIRYVISQTPTQQELKALTLLALNMGQKAGENKKSGKKQTLHPRIHRKNQSLKKNQNQHLILIGTPSSTPEIATFTRQFHRFKLHKNKWAEQKRRKTPQGRFKTIPQEAGLLLYFRNPTNPKKTVLIVTGNSPEGVLQAAKYLTFHPQNTALKGQEYWVTQNWQPEKTESFGVPRYIENETRTFKELGFSLREIEKISAPPITYPVSVVSHFNAKNNAFTPASMALELLYSYGAGINPQFSSLEVRLNDRSIGNIPLTNPNGQERAKATLAIPNELIQTQNQLVTQFHLLPEKYEACVDHYNDKSWGKIHSASRFIVKGQPQSRLPDVALLNNTGFPYSRKNNLESLHLILSKTPNANLPEDLLESVLAVLTRLGQSTLADTELHPTVAFDFDTLPEGKDVLAFVQQSKKSKGTESSGFPDLRFQFRHQLQGRDSSLIKSFQLGQGQTVQISDAGEGLYMEQAILSQANPLLLGFNAENHILTQFTGSHDTDFKALRRLFEDDHHFEHMVNSGFLKQLNPKDLTLNTISAEPPKSDTAIIRHSKNFWETLLHGMTQHPFWATFFGFALFLLLVVLLLLFRRNAS